MKISIPYNWTPRIHYQLNVWNYFQKGGSKLKKRALCVWPRRHGKDLIGVNLVADSIMERVGAYWHVFPEYRQGRKIVWDGKTKEGRAYMDHFPPELVKRKYENDMRIHFMDPHNPNKEGSTYYVVGSDNANSLIGTNPVGVILSEYAVQDPAAWQLLRPILRENDGWALFISTVRGHNHLYELRNAVKNNPDWFYEELSCRDTRRDDGSPVIGEEDIAKDRAEGMPEELIRQEYYSDWDAPLVGAYYSVEMEKAHREKRIATFPVEPRLPVITSWDIGTDDATAIIFSQEHGLEKRIIDYYENSGEGLPHYVKILKERGYVYSRHNLPWDIEVREFTSGKARIETLRKCLKDYGITGRITVCQQHETGDAVEQGRLILPYCWFHETKCDRLIQALKTYRKKWDEKLRTFSSFPVRDWSTHACNAFQILAWNSSSKRKEKQPRQIVAEDNYQYV